MKTTLRMTLLSMALASAMGCSQKSAEELVAQAEQSLAQGQYDVAIIELKNAIQADNTNGGARLLLGEAYFAKDQFDSAIKELRHAEVFGGLRERIVPVLAESYLRTEAWNELAQLSYDLSRYSDYNRAKLEFYRAQALVNTEKDIKFSALLMHDDIVGNATPYGQLLAAMRLSSDGMPEASKEYVENALAIEPNNRDALLVMARLAVALKDDVLMAEIFDAYVEAFPQDNKYKMLFANILLDAGYLTQAEAYVDVLLSRFAKQPALYQMKGVIKARQGAYDEAMPLLEQSVNLGNRTPQLRLAKGFVAFQLKDMQTTYDELSIISDRLADNHPALRLLAISQLELGLSEEAARTLLRNDAAAPEDNRLLAKTGIMRLQQNDRENAQALLNAMNETGKSTDDLMQEGILKLSLADASGVLDIEKAVASIEQQDNARRALASAYLTANQMDKAKALQSQWQAASPDAVEPYVLAANIASAEDDSEAAETALVTALDKAPENIDVLNAVASFYLSQRDMGKAETFITRALAIEPKNSNTLMLHYLLEASRDNGEVVIDTMEALLTGDQDNADVAINLARIYADTQQFDAAKRVISTLPEEVRVTPQLLRLTATVLAGLKDKDALLAHYKSWAEKRPYDTQGLLGELSVLDRTGQADKAKAKAEAFLARKDDPRVVLYYAHLLTAEGDLRRSQQRLRTLPELLLKTPFGQSVEARNALLDDKPAKALPAAEYALQMRGDVLDLIVMVNALEAMERETEAQAVIEQYVKTRHQTPTALIMLADRVMSSTPARAIALYKQVLEIDSDNVVALNNLAYLYFQDGALDKAEPMARQALAQIPENVSVADTLAQVLLAQSKVDEAVSTYEHTAIEQVRDDSIYLNYVEALAKQGKLAIATRRLSERPLKTHAARVAQLRDAYGL